MSRTRVAAIALLVLSFDSVWAIDYHVGFVGMVPSDYTESPPGGDPAIWGTINSLGGTFGAGAAIGDTLVLTANFRAGMILPQDMYFGALDTYTQIGGGTGTLALLASYRIALAPVTASLGAGASLMYTLKTFTDYVDAGALVHEGPAGYFSMIYPSPVARLGIDVSPLASGALTIFAHAQGAPYAVAFISGENASGPFSEVKHGFAYGYGGGIALRVARNWEIAAGYNEEHHLFAAPAPDQVDLKIHLRGPYVEVRTAPR